MRRKIGSDDSGAPRTRVSSQPSRTIVGEVMSRDIPAVQPETSADTLANVLVERGLQGAPVVDDEGRLQGFVSLADLEREHAVRGDTLEEDAAELRTRTRGIDVRLPPGFHEDPIAHATVGEVMTRAPVLVHEATPLSTAVAVMAFENVDALPVVGADGCVRGVLYALDLVRWLARENGYPVPDRRPRRRRVTS